MKKILFFLCISLTSVAQSLDKPDIEQELEDAIKNQYHLLINSSQYSNCIYINRLARVHTSACLNFYHEQIAQSSKAIIFDTYFDLKNKIIKYHRSLYQKAQLSQEEKIAIMKIRDQELTKLKNLKNDFQRKMQEIDQKAFKRQLGNTFYDAKYDVIRAISLFETYSFL